MPNEDQEPIDAKAFLAFSLGPVQPFIEAARSVRDLWTGSYLLSWLTYSAMEPILDKLTPEAIVFPSMSKNPLRRYYGASNNYQDALHRKQILLPCIPNRFLAELPDATVANQIAQDCEVSCHDAWRGVQESVRAELNRKINEMCESEPSHDLKYLRDEWDRLWKNQCDSYFEVRTSVLPFETCDDDLLQRLLPDHSSRSDSDNSGGESNRWVGMWELSNKLLQSRRSVRHFPHYELAPGIDVSHKCSLLGTYEQMGPAVVSESKAFWRSFTEISVHGTRIDRTERLCAISLVKRFAWPVFFAGKSELDLNPRERRSRDTATTAGIQWLAEGDAIDWEDKKSWSGQWLHWQKQNEGEERGEDCPKDDVWQQIQRKKSEQGSAPTYYAIVMLDGDSMGKWLRGRGIYRGALQGRSRHEAFSNAVSEYALERAPNIVEDQYQGQLIYAGGDDVLAMLPTAKAFDCARKLSEAFQEIWPDELLTTKGEKATVSAGVAVVHYKEDLRFALRAARDAEKTAKHSGRNAVALSVCRRSGTHTTAVCGWDFVPTVQEWVDKFVGGDNKPGASDRWAYHLAAEVPTLRALPREAMRVELCRQVSRGDSNGQPSFSADKVAAAFDEYLSFVNDEKRLPRGLDADNSDQRSELTGQALDSFVTLCQSASFLARGRKE